MRAVQWLQQWLRLQQWVRRASSAVLAPVARAMHWVVRMMRRVIIIIIIIIISSSISIEDQKLLQLPRLNSVAVILEVLADRELPLVRTEFSCCVLCVT